jgi:OmpA-OmpF porin, OOP family
MRRLVLATTCGMSLLLAGGTGAAQTKPAYETPKPQYSVEEIQKDFSGEPDGVTTRGFSLPGTKPAGPSNAARAPGGSRPQAAATPRPVQRRNLLITFANASSDLTAQAKANARVFAQAINSPSLAGARFAIEGHTNAVGGRDYNMSLSKARAQALADFLVAQGVAASRLDVEGYGFDRLSDTRNPRGERNRRVEARKL